MAKLTAAARRALPDTAFAGPNRSFPVEDAAHARAAMMMMGKAPKSARPNIERRAKAMLKKSAPMPAYKMPG